MKGGIDMNILVACEESQRVCIEFRKKGHNAYSCDIQECSGGHPEWHIKGDVIKFLNGNIAFTTEDYSTHREMLNKKWDMIIAFPPCTHLCVSGSRHFEKKRNDGRQKDAIDFFYKFVNADCEHISIENPVGIIGGEYIKKWYDIEPYKPTQIIQPYYFGDKERKTTCLWLKGLPKLEATNIVEPEYRYVGSRNNGFSGALAWAVDEQGKILSWNDPRTAKQRSKTYPGIAKAMAEQWG